MALANAYHHGTRVSKSHAAVLAGYERDRGEYVHVNEGRRTLAEQRAFRRAYEEGRGPVAARPYPGAPHIKYRREHHALDINDGLVDRVASYYRSLGIPVAFNVSGEAWHMDVLNEGALKRAAAKLGGVERTLRKGSKGPSVVKLKKLLYKNGLRNFSGKDNSNRYAPYFGEYTENAVRRFQRKNGMKADGVVGAQTWRKLRS